LDTQAANNAVMTGHSSLGCADYVYLSVLPAIHV